MLLLHAVVAIAPDHGSADGSLTAMQLDAELAALPKMQGSPLASLPPQFLAAFADLIKSRAKNRAAVKQSGGQFGDLVQQLSMKLCCLGQHGWQTNCAQTKGCTLFNSEQLVGLGAFSSQLPTMPATHILAAARDATRRFNSSALTNLVTPPLPTLVPELRGKVLRVRT